VGDHGGNNVADVAGEEEDAGDDRRLSVMLENSLSLALVQMLSKVKVESSRYPRMAERRINT